MTTTEHVQPDLFGDHDREAEAKRRDAEEAARRRQIWQSPHTCPACGTEEPNGYLLNNNHGISPEQPDCAVGGFPPGQHPSYGSKCVAQALVSNHIAYDAREGRTERLERSMARGRELNLDVEAIRAAATGEAAS